MKVPCPPKCPDRSATCHCTCEKYLDFVKENELAKQKKYRENNIDWALVDIKKGLFKK